MARLREQDMITALGVEQDAIAFLSLNLAGLGAGGHDRMVRRDLLVRDPQAQMPLSRGSIAETSARTISPPPFITAAASAKASCLGLENT